jgi:hypothetical protein
MSTKLFFIWIAGLALFMFSCNGGTSSDMEGDTGVEEYEPDPKSDQGEQLGYPDQNGSPELPDYSPSIELVLSVDDIISFNVSTGEIIFNDDVMRNKEFYPIFYDNILTINLNEEPLFESIRTISTVSSVIYNDLAIVFHKSKIYLVDGYPPKILDIWPEKDRNNMRKERDENAEKRKVEWDIFIKYLTDKGKIVQ